MKKNYQAPEFDVILFNEDVIVTSDDYQEEENESEADEW